MDADVYFQRFAGSDSFSMEQTLKEQAEEYLQEIGVKFQTIDDRRFKVGYVGLNLKLIEVLVRFSEDDANDFIMTSYSVGCSFSGDLYHEGLELCNELNNEFRWVKFYLDEEQNVVAEYDAYVDDGSCGPAVCNAITKIVAVLDRVYPRFMTLRWG